MVRKLEVDELRATIGATRDLLGEAQAAEDLIAVHQLGKKISSLEVSLKALEGAPEHSDKARVVEEELPPQAGQIVGFTSKTFEFVREDGEKISGRIDSVPARQLEQAGVNQQIQQFMYTPLRVRLRVRTVESGGWSRRYYTLLALDDRKA